MEERKLTRKDLRRCWRAWMMHNLSSMSFERLESFGFCLSMLPVAKKLYPDPVQRTEMLRRHASFYNTEPQIGAIVNGMALGLEEKKANGEPIDGETINTLKVGLMEPIAGIVDSRIPGMLIPILLSIGMALAAGENILCPLFYTVACLAIIIPGSWFLFLKGYQMGSGSVEMLVSSKSTRLREALSLLGVFVMGGVAASKCYALGGLAAAGRIAAGGIAFAPVAIGEEARGTVSLLTNALSAQAVRDAILAAQPATPEWIVTLFALAGQ